jgi:uncharacterized protein YndB with AHSA1/START domain
MPSYDGAPVVSCELLIRAAPDVVYSSFVEPARLTRFWLAKASARLEVGKPVEWQFMVPGATDVVEAKTLEPGRRIVVASKDGTTIGWHFTPHPEGTIVAISQTGFGGTADDAIALALEATQGFTLVLCALKLLLERGQAMDIVNDKARLIAERSSS